MPIESNRVSTECRSCREKDPNAEEGAFKLFYTSRKTYFCRNCISDIKIGEDGVQVVIEKVEDILSEPVKPEPVETESENQIKVEDKIEEGPMANNIKTESEPSVAA